MVWFVTEAAMIGRRESVDVVIDAESGNGGGH